jgi:hypothetical protein
MIKENFHYFIRHVAYLKWQPSEEQALLPVE